MVIHYFNHEREKISIEIDDLSREELKDLRAILVNIRLDIEMQIAESMRKYHEYGEHSDPVWYARCRCSRIKTIQNIHFIETRMNKLRREQRGSIL
jgi:hypothetical protein